MTEEKGSKLPALFSIKDLLGVSEPAKHLIEAIRQGIGELSDPWLRKRKAVADIEIARLWRDFLSESKLPPDKAELLLGRGGGIVRFLSDLSRHDDNRHAIATAAIDDFRENRGTQATNVEPIDADWLDRYWRLAENVSNEDFQSLWGRILSRAALGTNTFSPRCLETLSLLTRREAETLTQLAPMVSGMRSATGEVRYFLLYDVESQAARKLNTEEEKKHLLEANAAIRSTLGEWYEQMFAPIGIYASTEGAWAISATAPFMDRSSRFSVAGVEFQIEGYPTSVEPELSSGSQIKIGHAVPFSAVGGEIIGLIETKPNEDYVAALRHAFSVTGLTMTLRGNGSG